MTRCELLDIGTARCKDYANRLRRVPTCHELTPTSVPMYQGWLPESCAYVRAHKGQALPAWHPLLAGDHSRMHRKGITISHYAIPSGMLSRRQKERHIVSRWSISKKCQQQRGKATQNDRGGRQTSPSSRRER